MKVKFISLASGSSGNCYYIGTEKYGILIDAGIAVRTIKKGLKEAGISMEMIRAVFVTHDHADHIKAVGGLGEKQNIPIYTTARIHGGYQPELLHDRKVIFVCPLPGKAATHAVGRFSYRIF